MLSKIAKYIGNSFLTFFFSILIIALILIVFNSYSNQKPLTTASVATSDTSPSPRANPTDTAPAYPPPGEPTSTSTPIPTITPVEPSPTVFPTAISLDKGPKVIFADTNGGNFTLWAASVVNPVNRKIIAVAEESIIGYNVSISHKKDKIALVSSSSMSDRIHSNIWIVDISSGKMIKIASNVDLGRYLNYPSWSSDDSKIAVIRQSGTNFPYEQSISLVNVDTGEETTIIKSSIKDADSEGVATIYPLDWSSDNRYFYYQQGAFGTVDLWRIDLKDNTTRQVSSITNSGIPRCYYLSPDSLKLLCMVSSKDLTSYAIKSISINDGKTDDIAVDIPAENFSDPIWNPDGKSITLAMFDSTSKLLKPYSIDTESHRSSKLPADKSLISAAIPRFWSSDSTFLVLATLDKEPKYFLVNTTESSSTDLTLPPGSVIVGWTDLDLSN